MATSLINPALEALTMEGLRRIGEHVQRARKEAFRESRETFAKRLGCTPTTLDRIERGDPGVKVAYVAAALEVMGALRNVVDAASPELLIATTKPVSFPPGFESAGEL